MKAVGGPRTSVRLDGQAFNAAAGVIGDQDVPAVPIHHQMARAASAGGLLVQKREFSRRHINGKRADRSGRFALEGVDFIDGVKKAMIGGDFQVRWTGGFGRNAEGGQRAGGRVHAPGVDAFALGAGVGAGVNQAGAPAGDGGAPAAPRPEEPRKGSTERNASGNLRAIYFVMPHEYRGIMPLGKGNPAHKAFGGVRQNSSRRSHRLGRS